MNLPSLLNSRGFWVLIAALVDPVCEMVGATEKVEPVTVIVLALAAYFGVTLTRMASGEPTSYAGKESSSF